MIVRISGRILSVSVLCLLWDLEVINLQSDRKEKRTGRQERRDDPALVVDCVKRFCEDRIAFLGL